MTQKVVNGFPQYFSYTYLSGAFYGTPVTESVSSHTDINLQSDLQGDSIDILPEESGILSVFRDGVFLHESQGYEIIAPNVVRVFGGLLDTETVEFKKLVGASGVIEQIPVHDPVVSSAGHPHSISEATVYTDGSVAAVNGLEAVVINGKTRITAEFSLNEGRIDVYINGTRSSVNDNIWELVDSDTIELNEDYSSVKMKVDIIKQKVG